MIRLYSPEIMGVTPYLPVGEAMQGERPSGKISLTFSGSVPVWGCPGGGCGGIRCQKPSREAYHKKSLFLLIFMRIAKLPLLWHSPLR